MSALLKVRGLKKSYAEVDALKGIDFDLFQGEILAVLGPNGAGKTTTINCLSHLIPSSGGDISFQGESGPIPKESIGLCPQELILWEQLTLKEQLTLAAKLYKVPHREIPNRMNDLLNRLGLKDKGRSRGKALSGGMKRRVNIALSLMHDPKIWILDEPEAGLDPQSRILVREFIADEAQNRGVLLTTHNMDEAQRVAHRILLIDQGRIIAHGSCEELLEQHHCKDLEELFLQLTGRSLRE